MFKTGDKVVAIRNASNGIYKVGDIFTIANCYSDSSFNVYYKGESKSFASVNFQLYLPYKDIKFNEYFF